MSFCQHFLVEIGKILFNFLKPEGDYFFCQKSCRKLVDYSLQKFNLFRKIAQKLIKNEQKLQFPQFLPSWNSQSRSLMERGTQVNQTKNPQYFMVLCVISSDSKNFRAIFIPEAKKVNTKAHTNLLESKLLPRLTKTYPYGVFMLRAGPYLKPHSEVGPGQCQQVLSQKHITFIQPIGLF